MRIKPIRSDKIADKIVDQFIEMIRDGELKPGDKLPNEMQMAGEFGVSRGILREALTVLQTENYIRRKPKEGTYVTEDVKNLMLGGMVQRNIRRATYSDLMDFRSGLEQVMVQRAIDRADDEEIEELFSILEEDNAKEQEGNPDYYFHYKLAQLSRNTFYMNFIDTYYDLINEVAQKARKDEKRKQMIIEEHLAIAHAIQQRDKEAARCAVLKHLDRVAASIERNGI